MTDKIVWSQDGLESVRKLREWEKDLSADGCRQHVLGASACTRAETKQSALGVGMDAFIVKPLEIPELLHKLNDLHVPFQTIL
jgi:CheY-like chemotaxis protein